MRPGPGFCPYYGLCDRAAARLDLPINVDRSRSRRGAKADGPHAQYGAEQERS
jgi:hypothetical protein